jgi:hypothetical protein
MAVLTRFVERIYEKNGSRTEKFQIERKEKSFAVAKLFNRGM